MKNWDAAIDKIRRRNPELVLASIEVQSPFTFDPVKDLSDIPDYLDSIWPEIEGQADVVVDLPGRDMNFARDTVIALYKLFHLLDCAVELKSQGRLTWSLVDSYHVSLLAARSIASMYGVLSYTVRGRTVLVDFRPELGSPDEIRAFGKSHKELQSPIRVLRPNKELMDQKEAWMLLKRLADITTGDEEQKRKASPLATLSKQPISAIRNKILYDSVYWTWRSDFSTASEAKKTLALRYASTDEHVRILLDALEILVSSSRDLSAKLCSQIGFPLERLPASAAGPANSMALSGT